MPKGYYFESGGTKSTDNRSRAEHARGISLSPQQIITGICFHLLEEKLATHLDARSIRRQAARLERDGLCVTLARDEWRTMTNLQRLHHLLFASEIAFAMTSDGRSVLLAND